MAHSSSWGYVTTLAANDGEGSVATPAASVLSFSDGDESSSTGRLWFYIMSDEHANRDSTWAASLTLSQTGLNTTCGSPELDPEDPRCAKITFTGKMSAASGDDAKTGHAALVARHPQMAHWPKDHGFRVHELKVAHIWMIDFYGGGGDVDVALYAKATPAHNVPHFPPHPRPPISMGATTTPAVVETSETSTTANQQQAAEQPPPFNHTAARARWLVYHSVWTSVGTISVHLKGLPWGNVRSVGDGVKANSTGLPNLYLPTPDPTAVDVAANDMVTLSFSEAALKERFTPGQGANVCGGNDAMDPTCARLHLTGKLVPIATKDGIQRAMANLGAHHPLAPWLARGGAHTGGQYFTLQPTSLVFLDNYGGPAELSVTDYLAAKYPFA